MNEWMRNIFISESNEGKKKNNAVEVTLLALTKQSFFSLMKRKFHVNVLE